MSVDKANNTKNILFHWHDFRIKIVVEGILVGIFVGFLIVAYRVALERALDFSKYIYHLQHKNIWLIPIWMIVLMFLGYIVGVIVEKEPMTSGSGIPQVEGVLLRKLKMNWWKVVVVKFIGGVLSIGAGLSLGREGPSIQIGAAAGQGVSRVFKRIKLEEKYLITSGASAGLAAAFNAPLSGVIFALEEVHKNFSPIVMTSALAASITADFVTTQFFGLKPIFSLKHYSPIPLIDYGYIIVLGIIIGFAGIVFNKTLLGTQKLYASQKWLSAKTRPIIPFIFAGIFGFILPVVLGGGNELITMISNTSLSFKLLLVILVVKFFFTMISYGSSAPGGIFLPLLVIGALLGVVYGDTIHFLFGFNQAYIVTIIILAMAGYFTAIVKAPITGIVLITEMSGSFNHLLSIAVVCLTAYMVVEFMDSKPIYESLLERILNKGHSKFEGKKMTKVLIESAVCLGSEIEGKKVKDIDWPTSCLLVSIKRGHEEIIPKGDTKIYAGDYLIVLANEDTAAEIRECIAAISKEFVLEK